MPQAQKPTLILVDGHAHLFQAYHAIRELNDPQGRPVNAVYGVVNMILRLFDKFNCTHFAMVFDSKGPTFRHDIYPEYKANRGEMDEELAVQIPILYDLLKAMNIPSLALKGYECDDIVGTLSHQAAAEGFHVIMVSEDKDFGQLIEKNVDQYRNRKDLLVNEEGLKDILGVRPDQVIDYLALIGDTSDNVPGVPGIGPKTAVTFLETYETADNLYDHIDEIKGKKKENLEAHRDTFDLAKELVTIKRDVPINIKLDELARQDWDAQVLGDAFRELGFKRLIERLNIKESSSDNSKGSQKENVKRKYEAVTNQSELKTMLKMLEKHKILAIDTETTGFDPYTDRLVGLSLSWAPGKACYLPFESPDETLDLEKSKSLLGPFLQRDITWVGHNLKFDAGFLQSHGLPLGDNWQDTLLMAFLSDSGNRQLKLDDLAFQRLGESLIAIKDLIGTGKKAITMDAVPLEKIVEYACEDADITLRLYELLKKETDKTVLDRLKDQEIPLSRLLLKMESHGVHLDTKLIDKLSKKAKKDLAKLEKQIHDLVGHEFNIGSPKQLGQVLFEELGLPIIRKTKTGYSTDSKVLAELASHHEVPALVESYRQLAKLISTYLDALPEMIDAEDCLHTSYSQTAAITGRLASTRPNLQNIPIRTERGRAIREAIGPRLHDTFLSSDYSQIELRLMAHFSEDPALCKAFADKQDIHRFVAAEINGIDPEEVDDDQRAAAKAVNFGILYGQGAFGLAGQLQIAQKDAKDFIEKYFERFSTIRNFIDNTIEEAKDKGYVETLGGHRRPIRELQSKNAMQRKMGERIAVNTLMQGSAADLIKVAMLNANSWLETNQPDTAMVLQIHDELIFDVPAKDVEALANALQPIMTEALPLNVPLEISVHSGPNLMAAK